MSRKKAKYHGVVYVDKPAGMSSHDVVNRLRRRVGQRRVGHAGTLDPMATGVLIILLGEATKLVPYIMAARKSYHATIRLGADTTTLDREGDVRDRMPVPTLTHAQVVEVAQRFCPSYEQTPPGVSALKVDGVRAYKLARAGEEPKLAPRQVALEQVRVLDVRENEIELELDCGKGFYVRSFARDLAQALGTLGHLNALRRTTNAHVRVDACHTLATIESEPHTRWIVSIADSMVLPILEVEPDIAEKLSVGMPTLSPEALAPGHFLVLDKSRKPIAIAEVVVDRLAARRGFRFES